MKSIKRIVCIICLCALVASISLPKTNSFVFAAEENIGVSNIEPTELTEDGEILEKGVSRPTETWDISKKGKYVFIGDPGGQVLYTNYWFTGKTHYTIKVHNTGSYTLKVKAKRRLKTYATTTIAAGDTVTFSFSGIEIDRKFYITFEGSKFSGYIK